MPMEMSEFENLEEHQGRAFGAVSEDRNKIIKWLAENGAGTPAEIQEATGVEKAKTRLDVMRRDGLVTWRDRDDEVFYALTDKGTSRAEGKKEKKKAKKK